MSAEEENMNLEARLRAVELPAANVNRDRLMFQAGAAAERSAVLRGQRGWQLATGALAATAAALALVVTLRPASERVVYVERPAPPMELTVNATTASLPAKRQSAEMIQLRDLALRGEWRDPPADNASPSGVVTPTSLPRFDLNKAAGDAFPTDGRM